jgi:ABC-2 type transport system ATP-binding protein
MQRLAEEGRTVFLSSHLMSEMELTADRLIVIGRGRLIAETSVSEFIDANSQAVTAVQSPKAAELRLLLEGIGAIVELDSSGGWRVTGPDRTAIGDLALASGIALHELRSVRSSLEDVYTRLTEASVEYRAGAGRVRAN